MVRYPLQIPVPENTWLAADLYTPDSTQALPVIFIQTPYNKSKYWYTGVPLNTEDYAFVIMDWRGMYGSAHAARPQPQYGQDGAIAIEWIADQTWCNGRVGTFGNSAMGQIQFLTALYQPEHLVCCVPLNHPLESSYDKYYHGGVKRAEFLHSLSNWQPIPYIVGNHPLYDQFWENVEQMTGNNASDITVPILLITGWWDMTADQNIKTYYNLREQTHPSIRNEHRLLIGPWTHNTAGQMFQGEWTYPEARGRSEIAAMRFFDHWLRDDPEIPYYLPDVACFELGSNEFLFLDEWPSPDAERLELYLHDGVMIPHMPTETTGVDSFQYNPETPLWTPGGRTHSVFLPAGPVDLSDLMIGDDILVYDTPVLNEPVEISGTIRADLYVSSDCMDTDVSVILADVYPDGRVQFITDGIRRLRFRNDYTEELLAWPGTIHCLEIPMQDMQIAFQPGHRIRLYVNGSNFPRFDRNLNNGGEMYQTGPMYISNTKVYRSALYPSALVFNAQDNSGPGPSPASATQDDGVTALPQDFGISAYPNPFNERASVQVALPERGELTVAVYNVNGQQVATLAQGEHSAGTHTFSLDASGWASGVYFVRATLPSEGTLVRKVMLVR